MGKLCRNTTISRDFCWSDAAFIDVGKVRKVNEDDFMANATQAHWAVADGMGGHDKGDVASRSICEALKPLEQSPAFDLFVDAIDDRLIEVNHHLRQLAAGDAVIGSTVAGLAIHQGYALYYWAGDSRIYRLRDQKLTQLSIDHTYTQELVDRGELAVEEVGSHPDKNVITRAVGADDEVFVDFEMVPLAHNDVFFICSDGVEKEMSDEDVEATLKLHGDDIEVAGRCIIDTVLEQGARDNVTLILVRVTQS